MDKSILIINTPKSCTDCRLKRGLFCGENGNSLYDYIHYDDSINDKPDWCPLRPLPKRVGSASEYGSDEEYIKHLIIWKKKVDEILGEE